MFVVTRFFSILLSRAMPALWSLTWIGIALLLSVGRGSAAAEPSIPAAHGPFYPLTTTPVRYAQQAQAACSFRACYGAYDPTTSSDIGTCTVIRGTIRISGAIRYPPTCLTSVEGSVEIENNDLVTSMYGFNGLEEITGNLVIKSNPHFTSLRGLDSLRVVKGSIYLESLTALLSLSALDAVIFRQGDIGEAWHDQQRREYIIDDSDSLDDAVLPLDDSDLHFARRARSRHSSDPLQTTLLNQTRLKASRISMVWAILKAWGAILSSEITQSS